MRYKGFLASSSDPTGQTLSLSVASAAKVIIGLVGTFVAYKGFNPATVTTQLQAITDLVITLIPMGFTVWHSIQLLWGLVRKLIATLGTIKTPPPAV